MKTWRIAGVLAVVVSVSWAIPARSQTIGLYEDFNSGAFDTARWFGYEYGAMRTAFEGVQFEHRLPFETMNEAHARAVVDGQARIALTSFFWEFVHPNDYDIPSLLGWKGISGLRINHPALADQSPRITTLQATVTVADVSVPDDPPDTRCGPRSAGRAGAHVSGHFFSDRLGGESADLTGDVFARVALERRIERSGTQSQGVRNVIEISVARCNNANCSEFVPFGTAHVLPRGWTIGVPHVVTITWTPSTASFSFTVVGGGFTQSHVVVYDAATDVGRRARAYAHDLRIETHPAICRDLNVEIRQRVSIDARFDDVYLNANAAAATR
jgi:hypothetical protein